MARYCPKWHDNLAKELRQAQRGIRSGFSVPKESRFVMLVEGVPLGCDTITEICDLINHMVEHQLPATISLSLKGESEGKSHD